MSSTPTPRTVRVAIAGIGNCANSLIQGVHYYSDATPDTGVPGLMNVDLGGYHVGTVEFVAAFDVDAGKVGQDLSKAMWGGLNNTTRFCDVSQLDVGVQRGLGPVASVTRAFRSSATTSSHR